jgi:hypothetical protein
MRAFLTPGAGVLGGQQYNEISVDSVRNVKFFKHKKFSSTNQFLVERTFERSKTWKRRSKQ